MSNHFMKKRKKKKKRDSEAKRMNLHVHCWLDITTTKNRRHFTTLLPNISSDQGKKVFLTTRLVNKGNKSYDKEKN